MDYLVCALLIGVGATAVMDIWTVARKRLLGIPALDYGLVGRWLAYLARGRFRHDRIAASPPVPRERLIGWTAHYLIGIAFAAVLLAICGLEWARHPTIGPALIVGIGSVAAPFFLMQPGMGAGVAASRTLAPRASRVLSPIRSSAWAFMQPAGLRVGCRPFKEFVSATTRGLAVTPSDRHGIDVHAYCSETADHYR